MDTLISGLFKEGELAENFMSGKLPPLAGVIPHLTCEGAEQAVEQYKAAFDAELLAQMVGDDGRIMHACIVVNGTAVYLHDAWPENGALDPNGRGGSSVTMHLMLDKPGDVDAWHDKAVAAGMVSRLVPEDMFWGDRYAEVTDKCGHNWAFASPLAQ